MSLNSSRQASSNTVLTSANDLVVSGYNHNFTSSDFQSKRLPFPFGRICFVVLVMKKEGRAVEQFLSFRLYIGSFPCAQLPGCSSYSPVGPSVFFCI